MKITESMQQKINQVAEEAFYDYEMIAIRVQEEAFELGSIDHVSHIWEDGEDTGEELDGICAIRIDQIRSASDYFGGHIAVLGSNSYEYGEDAGEVILQDAEVLAILA